LCVFTYLRMPTVFQATTFGYTFWICDFSLFNWDHYMGQCAEGLYVKVETTRTVRAGEELLTNYGLDFTGQWATRCGYDYYAVTVLGEARGEGERQDPEACPDSQNRSRRRG
jgi:hypothetical protein